jgi:hypothetical protein
MSAQRPLRVGASDAWRAGRRRVAQSTLAVCGQRRRRRVERPAGLRRPRPINRRRHGGRRGYLRGNGRRRAASLPDLAIGRAWFAAAIFLGVLISYVVAGAVLVGQLEAPAVVPLRVAVVGAIGLAARWLGIGAIASYAPSKALSTALMVALPVTSFTVGGVAAWQTASVRAARNASLLSAIGAGLLGFVIWMGDTLLTAGRPYDPGKRCARSRDLCRQRQPGVRHGVAPADSVACRSLRFPGRGDGHVDWARSARRRSVPAVVALRAR